MESGIYLQQEGGKAWVFLSDIQRGKKAQALPTSCRRYFFILFNLVIFFRPSRPRREGLTVYFSDLPCWTDFGEADWFWHSWLILVWRTDFGAVEWFWLGGVQQWDYLDQFYLFFYPHHHQLHTPEEVVPLKQAWWSPQVLGQRLWPGLLQLRSEKWKPNTPVISSWTCKIFVGQFLPTTNLLNLAIVVQHGGLVTGRELSDIKLP